MVPKSTVCLPLKNPSVFHFHKVPVPGCSSLPTSLTNIILNLPYGFAKNPGRMDSCMDTPHFSSKYDAGSFQVLIDPV